MNAAAVQDAMEWNALLTQPCGPALDYDPAFAALERNLRGKLEVQYGALITPPVAPDWRIVEMAARALLERSRDLRVAMALTRALLVQHGMAGLAQGLGLIDCLLTQCWDSMHPQLDADDHDDPTLRINSLAALTESAGMLRDLAQCGFVELPLLGPLSLRQLDYASGDLVAPPGQSALTMHAIDAALHDAPAAAFATARARIEQCLQALQRIEATLLSYVGPMRIIDLTPLSGALQRMRHLLDRQPGRAVAPTETALTALPGAPASGARLGHRGDVDQMFETILAYYRQFEPSSPVPLLIERAKRLASKNFTEIMEDLAPDGVAQLLVIRGPKQTQ